MEQARTPRGARERSGPPRPGLIPSHAASPLFIQDTQWSVESPLRAQIVATPGARSGPVHSSSSFIAVSIGPEAMVIMRPETDYERLKALTEGAQ
jgi:hypothetical protein